MIVRTGASQRGSLPHVFPWTRAPRCFCLVVSSCDFPFERRGRCGLSDLMRSSSALAGSSFGSCGTSSPRNALERMARCRRWISLLPLTTSDVSRSIQVKAAWTRLTISCCSLNEGNAIGVDRIAPIEIDGCATAFDEANRRRFPAAERKNNSKYLLLTSVRLGLTIPIFGPRKNCSPSGTMATFPVPAPTNTTISSPPRN